MVAKTIPDRDNAKDQEPVISPLERNRNRKFGTYSYRPEYAEIAFNILSFDDGAKTWAHVCNALCCSGPTLLRWRKKFPEFEKACIEGKKVGQMKWRDKLRRHAFSPTAEVNNGLIKLLSSNVYGIKEEVEPTVVIHNTNTITPEEEMKKRGIPLPKVDVEDIGDD